MSEAEGKVTFQPFKIFIYLFIFYYVYKCFAYKHLRAEHVYGAQKSQKKGSDPLELELHMAINHHVSAENQTWVVNKNNQYV